MTAAKGPSPKAAAKIIEEIAKFFRAEWLNKDTFEGWPFLPERRGRQPTAGQANAFFLGCCIDYHQLTRTAWLKAGEFCTKRVGDQQRDRLWNWIATHDPKTWDERWAVYGYLHPTPARHRKLHSIARTLVQRYGGDARQLWSKKNLGRLGKILEKELAVGPAIARMIIGGLRDHGVIKVDTSDLKPDTNVVRLMNAMGLSHTTKAEQVVADARRWFKEDPWAVDSALYHLGATYGAKTKTDVLRIHRIIRQWLAVRAMAKKRIDSMAPDLKHDSSGAVHFYPESSLHWVGGYIVEMRGRLRAAMYEEETLWAWVGFGFDGTLVSAAAIGGSPEHFSTPVRTKLKAKGLVEDPMGAEARRGNIEYYAAHSIDLETLRQSALLREAVSNQVRLVRELLGVIG